MNAYLWVAVMISFLIAAVVFGYIRLLGCCARAFSETHEEE